MSSTAYLLLLFLCISLHACNARRIGPLEDKKQMEKKHHHFTTKSDEKIGFDSSPKTLNIEGGNDKVGAGLVADSKMPKSRRSTHHHKRSLKAMMGKGTDDQSLVAPSSVSWRVPHHHKKRSQKQVEFDLDYAPPKTHPPSHN